MLEPQDFPEMTDVVDLQDFPELRVMLEYQESESPEPREILEPLDA